MESRKRGRDDVDETGEKRQRRPQPELRILLEQEKVSHVIGKGGSVVKGVIKQSGAYLKFSPPKEGTGKQVGQISGPLECIGTALELLAYQLSKYQSPDGKSQGLVLLVPSPQVGLIIGKQGQIVRSVQSQSGARIQISARPEAAGTDGAPVDQEVGLSGSPAAISTAARILLGYLFRQAVPAPAPFAQLPPPPYPVAGAPFWPQAPISAPISIDELEVRFALRPGEVSRIIGKGGAGIQSLCKQARVKLVFDKQVQAQVGGPSMGPAQIGTVRGDVANIIKSLELAITTLSTPATAGDTSPESSEQKASGARGIRFLLMVPSPVIGFLLGTKGAKIKETKQKSGAQINITGRGDAIWDHVTGVALQAVLIEGEAEQVTTAVKSLVQQLEDARQAPSKGARSRAAGSEATAEA